MILTNYQIALKKTKTKEINQIVNHMISNNKYNDLLILLLICQSNLYDLHNKDEKRIYLYKYLLSKLQSEEKRQLLLEIGKLSNKQIKELEERYGLYETDIHKIKYFLQPTNP